MLQELLKKTEPTMPIVIGFWCSGGLAAKEFCDAIKHLVLDRGRMVRTYRGLSYSFLKRRWEFEFRGNIPLEKRAGLADWSERRQKPVQWAMSRR